MDPKKSAAAALVLGMAIGAGAQKVAAPPPPVVAQAQKLRLLDDGRLSIALTVKVGAAQLGRDLEFAKDGDSPKLRGKAFDDPAALALGKAAAAFAAACSAQVPKLADKLSQP